MAIARQTRIYPNRGWEPTINDETGSLFSYLVSVRRDEHPYSEDNDSRYVYAVIHESEKIHHMIAASAKQVASFKETCDDHSWYVFTQPGV